MRGPITRNATSVRQTVQRLNPESLREHPDLSNRRPYGARRKHNDSSPSHTHMKHSTAHLGAFEHESLTCKQDDMRECFI